MAAQPGPGNEPVHTLYDEQGNEIPAEVNQREQDGDDDGRDQEEVEDVTVRDNRTRPQNGRAEWSWRCFDGGSRCAPMIRHVPRGRPRDRAS